MLVADHIAALRDDGETLRRAAERAGMEAKVPSCPRWTVTKLVGHIGMVHRWATQFVAEGRTSHAAPPRHAMERPFDPDALLAWYGEGHGRLVDALEAAPDDLVCWYFLDAPSPLAFWARRQAHETAIHRADAELASGEVTPYEPEFAADGIDELLGGFMSGRRAGRLRTHPPRSLAIQTADVDRHWTLHIGPEGTVLSRSLDDADCTLTGTASDLYLMLWNRTGPETVDVAGDRSVIDLWRKDATVRWG